MWEKWSAEEGLGGAGPALGAPVVGVAHRAPHLDHGARQALADHIIAFWAMEQWIESISIVLLPSLNWFINCSTPNVRKKVLEVSFGNSDSDKRRKYYSYSTNSCYGLYLLGVIFTSLGLSVWFVENRGGVLIFYPKLFFCGLTGIIMQI